MNRRKGNKSHKVPNVKLRPARPGFCPSQHEPENSSGIWAEESQAGSDDAPYNSCPRPFKGFVVCATGIHDKQLLNKQANELGASYVAAFTDRVTHLIAETHGGAKYECALQRNVPILRTAWIKDSHMIWLRGDDVDVEESIKQHRLPVFSGVVLSISGIKDILRRTEIHKLVSKQDGAYVKNLERPVKVTHLLCSGDEETDKIKYAEKFNTRGEARIYLVWEDWFWDSLERGGRLNEEIYDIRRPRPEKKPSQEDPATSPPPSPSVSYSPSQALRSPTDRPQVLATPDDEDEVAVIKLVPKVTLQLWESLLKPRGYEIADGQLQLSPKRSQQAARYENPPSPIPVSEFGPKKGSVLAKFSRTDSFVMHPPSNVNAEASSSKTPFGRTTTAGNLFNKIASQPSPPPSTPVHDEQESVMQDERASSKIFSGMNFRLLGEAKTASVRQAVEENGGSVVLESHDLPVDHIIVRIVSGSKFYIDEEDELERGKYRTECWLERCVCEQRVCRADEHATYTPLKIPIPLLGAEHVHLSHSGLDELEKAAIGRLGRALGFDVPLFSRRSTHLLCPSGTGAKFEQAQIWGIPVVGMDWLIEMINSALVPAAADYIVHGPSLGHHPQVGKSTEIEITDILVTRNASVKGKSKAQETDTLIHDITNNPCHKHHSSSAPTGFEPTQSLLSGPESNLDSGIRHTASESDVHESKDKRTAKGLDPSHTPSFHSFTKVNGIQAQSSFQRPREKGKEKEKDGGALPSSTSLSFESFGKPNGVRAQSSFQRRYDEDNEEHSDFLPTFSLSQALQCEANTGSSRLPTKGGEGTRVPSSATPSPMKIDGVRVSSSATPSPMKMPLDLPDVDERSGRLTPTQSHHPALPAVISRSPSKALKRSLTTLLGKRPSEEIVDRDSDAHAGSDGLAGARDTRQGKRPRPMIRTTASAESVVKIAPLQLPGHPPGYIHDELTAVLPDSMRISVTDLEEDQSILYDDPIQREEKIRLRSLLGTMTQGDQAGVGVPKSATTASIMRTSSRHPNKLIAGVGSGRHRGKMGGF